MESEKYKELKRRKRNISRIRTQTRSSKRTKLVSLSPYLFLSPFYSSPHTIRGLIERSDPHTRLEGVELILVGGRVKKELSRELTQAT